MYIVTHTHTHARTHAHTHAHTHERTYARTNALTHARTHIAFARFGEIAPTHRGYGTIGVIIAARILSRVRRSPSLRQNSSTSVRIGRSRLNAQALAYVLIDVRLRHAVTFSIQPTADPRICSSNSGLVFDSDPSPTFDSDPVPTLVFDPNPVLNYRFGLAFDSDSGPVINFALRSVFNSDSATNHSSYFNEYGGNDDVVSVRIPIPLLVLSFVSV
ncbi:hypothetical protein EVAR_20434_1 [Eumeta japonica]|uniref:Uncharacterized protein n=1 Tax=Eumeta variegata TaxID=151549 RepID=A0A4C1TXX2_EUMVA|nr:hypothetical protein EVAR_20434_1 [Eumeta japonica]